MTARGLALLAGVALTAASMLATGAPASAADYSLVTGTDYPPYADRDLPAGGLAVRIVRSALAAAGRSVDIQVLPWTRGYAMALQGRIDGTFPYLPSPERMADMAGSEPMALLHAYAWSAPSHTIANFSETAVIGSRMCLPLGYSMPDSVQALVDRREISVASPPTLANCATMIAGYHADFVIADALVMRMVMHQTGIELAPSRNMLGERPLLLLAARGLPKSARLLADFNAGLDRIRADGTYDRLLREAEPR